MILGILFSASQSKGGVYQYSMSVVNSLRKNKKIKSINIYTNNKDIDLKGCNIVLIKNYKLLFILSIISGFFNFYPKLLFGKPIEDSDPLLEREEFYKQMIVKPIS